jgi:hypothetical protein
MKGHVRAALTPAQQYLFLRHHPVCVGHGTLNALGLTWTYRVRPTPISREYEICITFRANDVPKVFVVSPDLTELAGGRELPHVYHNPIRLCLYLPSSGEWEGHMRIDKTFVPWTATWLYYFEEWLESDDWKGGGEHPDPNEAEHYNRNIRRSIR